MPLMMLSNLHPDTTEAQVQEFLARYGFPQYDEYEWQEGDGTRPAVTLTFRTLARLMTATLGVTLALLSSFATIIAFFSFTTESYPFMVVLNVIAFTIAGGVGLRFLVRAAKSLVVEGASPVELIRIWTVLFALVGAQMSWVLRPFIGSGDQFVLFQPRGANFFTAIYHTIRGLVG